MNQELSFVCRGCDSSFAVEGVESMPSALDAECGVCGAFSPVKNEVAPRQDLNKPERRVVLVREQQNESFSVESEQRYMITTLSLHPQAPLALLTAAAHSFDCVVYAQSKHRGDLGWLHVLDGLPFLVILLRDEDEAALDERESLLRRQLDDAGLEANEVPILRLDEGDLSPLLEVLDTKLFGPLLEKESFRWARPLTVNRRMGAEEYIASIILREDDEEVVPEFFLGAVLTAQRSSPQPRAPQTRSFSAELCCFTEQAADQVRRGFLPGDERRVLLHWYLRWPHEEGRPWPGELSALAEGALASEGHAFIMPTGSSLLFSAVIRMEASLRLSPGMKFLLSRAPSSDRVYALGRVIAGL